MGETLTMKQRIRVSCPLHQVDILQQITEVKDFCPEM